MSVPDYILKKTKPRPDPEPQRPTLPSQVDYWLEVQSPSVGESWIDYIYELLLHAEQTYTGGSVARFGFQFSPENFEELLKDLTPLYPSGDPLVSRQAIEDGQARLLGCPVRIQKKP